MNKFLMAATAIMMAAAISPVLAGGDNSRWEELVARREGTNTAYSAVSEAGKAAKQENGELLYPVAKHEKNK